MHKLMIIDKIQNYTAQLYAEETCFLGAQNNPGRRLTLSGLLMQEDKPMARWDIFDTPHTEELVDEINQWAITGNKRNSDKILELLQKSVEANYKHGVNRLYEAWEEDYNASKSI